MPHNQNHTKYIHLLNDFVNMCACVYVCTTKRASYETYNDLCAICESDETILMLAYACHNIYGSLVSLFFFASI